MSKLIISGYEKLQGVRINDWICTIVRETDEIYSFLFDFNPEGNLIVHSGFFNLVTIKRFINNNGSYELLVDFNIVRHNGFVEEFKAVRFLEIFPYQLISLNKFKELLTPLLVLSAT